MFAAKVAAERDRGYTKHLSAHAVMHRLAAESCDLSSRTAGGWSCWYLICKQREHKQSGEKNRLWHVVVQ